MSSPVLLKLYNKIQLQVTLCMEKSKLKDVKLDQVMSSGKHTFNKKILATLTLNVTSST